MDCEISKGFFVVNKCGALTQQTCHNCNRPACNKHIKDGYCTECSQNGSFSGTGPMSGGAYVSLNNDFDDDDAENFVVASTFLDDNEDSLEDDTFDDDSTFFDS
ncbi:MAG: hypothetical protein NE327_03030 [Lentisphaeraceae bacterium]|nr:hypothetical protein [Lentisphaeraceae bacterium]